MKSQIATSAEQIQAFGLLTLKGRLHLESKGMSISRGPSALSLVKSMFSIKARTAKEALPLYIKILEKKGILIPVVKQ